MGEDLFGASIAPVGVGRNHSLGEGPWNFGADPRDHNLRSSLQIGEEEDDGSRSGTGGGGGGGDDDDDDDDAGSEAFKALGDGLTRRRLPPGVSLPGGPTGASGKGPVGAGAAGGGGEGNGAGADWTGLGAVCPDDLEWCSCLPFVATSLVPSSPEPLASRLHVSPSFLVI
jgi:hypothetical protein